MSVPRPKKGQLKIGYGKLKDHAPDIVVASGEGTTRADRSLLLYAITSKTHRPLVNKWAPSLVDELIARGYDITTLKISIEKLKKNGEN